MTETAVIWMNSMTCRKCGVGRYVGYDGKGHTRPCTECGDVQPETMTSEEYLAPWTDPVSEYDKLPEAPMFKGHTRDCPCDACHCERRRRGIKFVATIKFPKRMTV